MELASIMSCDSVRISEEWYPHRHWLFERIKVHQISTSSTS
jgi:hypothetical protein